MNLLLYGFLALSILGALGGAAYKIRESGADAVRLEWATANEETRRREAEASAKAAADLATERAKRKVVTRERTVYVDKIIDRPVYRNVCIDADGLRCAAAAIAGESAAGCKPDGVLPAVKPPG